MTCGPSVHAAPTWRASAVLATTVADQWVPAVSFFFSFHSTMSAVTSYAVETVERRGPPERGGLHGQRRPGSARMRGRRWREDDWAAPVTIWSPKRPPAAENTAMDAERGGADPGPNAASQRAISGEEGQAETAERPAGVDSSGERRGSGAPRRRRRRARHRAGKREKEGGCGGFFSEVPGVYENC